MGTLTGRQPSLDSILDFGEVCFVQVPAELRVTRDAYTESRAEQARILGQDEGTSGWLVRIESSGTSTQLQRRSHSHGDSSGLPLTGSGAAATTGEGETSSTCSPHASGSSPTAAGHVAASRHNPAAAAASC